MGRNVWTVGDQKPGTHTASFNPLLAPSHTMHESSKPFGAAKKQVGDTSTSPNLGQFLDHWSSLIRVLDVLMGDIAQRSLVLEVNRKAIPNGLLVEGRPSPMEKVRGMSPLSPR